MNAYAFSALIAFLAIAIVITQHFSLKKKHAGYKNIKDATTRESEKLDSLKAELDSTIRLTKNEESKAAVAIERKTAADLSLEKLQATLKDIEKSIENSQLALSKTVNELTAIQTELQTHQIRRDRLATDASQLDLEKKSLEAGIKHLIALESREQSIHSDLEALSIKSTNEQKLYQIKQQEINKELEEIDRNLIAAKNELSERMGRIDLYSRIDNYTAAGHFELPNYLYETSARYQSEIKEIREQQRKLIREKRAIIYAENFTLSTNKALDKKILDGQVQLMLSAFNVECDLLIEKVSPANFDRTLEQIEKRAEFLEKNCGTMKCGFNIDYVELKFEECKLQFEYVLKKKDEQDAQRAIREQMREEIRVQKQYEEAVKEAEKEEIKFIRLLEKARSHLVQETEQERALSIAKIHLLEEQLKEAQERSIRAKSMAEQTRRGFVYVISNIGAFGEGVYKIGLTRRLDPQERVDELSSASVPFPFDVHAMCYSEDAPALEHALHKRFSEHRVNAVNYKKEFFRVELEKIQAALEEMVADEIDFLATAKAEDYYQSMRLMTASIG